jgi:alkanesulfonate monooxygenase SsuD/methylene tetrahydromethanopterin reductase-like flavin-dependent oxidoreductase (luciferase family)
MQNANRFKLGLFGMNCSGSFATTAPERWQAGWPENLEAACLADEAGLEFILPIARWMGYGGQTDRQGTSFESLSWASALLASTENIVAFSTIHVPLVHPVFAAKSIVTADHVGQGRFGINIVSGWNVEEFAMFGIPLREHDERYDYSAEWVSILKRIYSETGPFDYDGRYFSLKNVKGKPRPWGVGSPMLMSAGSSPAGRKFAVNNVDCLFMVITEDDKIESDVAQARATPGAEKVGLYASGHLLCRATKKETEEYYHYLVREKGDWEAAEQIIAKRAAGDGRSLSPELMRRMMERVISGGATFPVIGSYDEVAEKFLRLSNAGLDGMALILVNYVNEMPVLRDEVLPRLERLKIRQGRPEMRRNEHECAEG